MLETRNAPLPFKQSGTGRPSVLLIHGFLDASRVWDDVSALLADAGVASATVDLPGMGGTAAQPDELSLDHYAERVASVVEAIGGEIVVVGQSMGAQVAELVAARLPAAVKGLMLLTPVPLGGVGAPDEVVAPFKSAGGREDIQRQLRISLSHDLSGERLDRLVQLGLDVRPDVVERLVDMWNQGHETGRVASNFRGQVMIVRGASDPFVDENMAAGVADRFEHPTVAVVEAAGHWTHMEQPADVARLISSLCGVKGADVSAGDWKGAFAAKSRSAFADAFAPDVVLEASAMVKPVRGREAVQKVMEAASKVYRALKFTDQASADRKQYIEWEAEAHEGVAFDGVTILTRDESGAIAHIAIHHRPMEAAIFFSKTMGRNLEGVLDPGHFLETSEKSGEQA